MGAKDERDEEVQIASYENRHEDVRCSIGNAVHHPVVTVCGVRWVLDVSGHHFVSDIISNHWVVYLKLI